MVFWHEQNAKMKQLELKNADQVKSANKLKEEAAMALNKEKDALSSEQEASERVVAAEKEVTGNRLKSELETLEKKNKELKVALPALFFVKICFSAPACYNDDSD